MTGVVARRLGILLPTLLIGSMLIFAIEQIVPGGAALAAAGENASPKVIAQLNQEMGLNRPIPVQYASWLWGILHGNFGTSLVGNQSVGGELLSRLPITLALTAWTLVVALVTGITFGMLAAIWRRNFVGVLLVTASGVGIALPQFWIGMILVLIFGLRLGWLPATGSTPFQQDAAAYFKSMVLPVSALAAGAAAVLTRQVRASAAEVIESPYVMTARSLGLPIHEIYLKYVLKNALISVVTVMGLVATGLLGAEVIVESVFVLPGLGSMLVPAVTDKDFPIVQGVTLVYLFLISVVNLVVDLAHAGLDPRVRGSSS